MIIATAGHVDHGKTELVKALTGTDTDRLPEEKARGLSIDLGFAYQLLPDDKCLGFVDVPGHERFIRNMVAGVGGIDLGLLVVAADDGVMLQTREHYSILNLLGVDNYVVAITKVDLTSEDRVSQVSKQIENLLGKERFEKTKVFPVCAPENMGVEALATALKARGQSLYSRSVDGYFRLAIDRVFTLNGIGLVVTGMVLSGKTTLDDELVLSQDGRTVRVRGIRAHNTESDTARAGQRCALNIAGRGVSKNTVDRGTWLMHEHLYAPTNRIDVDLHVLDTEPRPLKHWTPTHLHVGTSRINARVAILAGGSIPAGDRGMAQLVLTQDAFVLHGDHFVLRDPSAQRTIAGGQVIDPFSPKRGRARPTRLSTLQAMNCREPHRVLEELTQLSLQGVLLKPFTVANNLSTAVVDTLVTTLSLKRVGDSKNQRVFNADRWKDLLDRIEESVSLFHRNHAETVGPAHREIQILTRPFVEMEVLVDATATLVGQGRLMQQGARFHLPTHKVTISVDDQKLWARSLECLAPVSGSPLSLHQASQALGLDVKILESSLKKAVKLGEMVRVGKNRYLPRHYLAKQAFAAEQVASQKSHKTFTVIDFCQQTSLGRNFAINLLEYFDELGLTRRRDNHRHIHRPAATFFPVEADISRD